MQKEINIYCDESCHLLNEKEKLMLVSCLWCDKKYVREITKDLVELKKKHGIYRYAELKWTNVSQSKTEYYMDLLEYFFSNKNLSFRTIIIPDKTKLKHERYNHSHNQWYYIMIYYLVKYLLKPGVKFNIYMDKKENSTQAKKELQYTLESIRRFYNADMQNIRSHESEIMQLNDFLQGAVGFYNRGYLEKSKSVAKIEATKEVLLRCNGKLDKTNRSKKFNILIWEPKNVG